MSTLVVPLARFDSIDRVLARLEADHTSLTYDDLSFYLRAVRLSVQQVREEVAEVAEAMRPPTQREVVGMIRAAFRRASSLIAAEAAL